MATTSHPVACGVAPAAAATGLVPVHPERTGDPGTVRWHTRLLIPDDAAAALRDLVAAGVLSRYTVTGDLTTTLAPGVTWAEATKRVRAAVRATLEAAATGRGLDPAARDAVLTGAAEQVITELVGPVAAGHGGSVRLIAVADGVVTVRMTGACRGCPAATITLQARLAAALRARVPWLREVGTG